MAESRKTYSITFNKGLDKASLPFEANPARALDALNYVYRDGKVQKRYGINQLAQTKSVNYRVIRFDGTTTNYYVTSSEFRLNGLWHFLAEDGAYHTIAHIGKLLFEVVDNGDEVVLTPFKASTNTTTYNGVNYIHCYQFENYKSVAIIGNKSLYFFGGNKLMRLRFPSAGTYSFKPVEDDENTYIPTTTISITYRNAKASGRASLDQVNLMTQWRKNRLLSGVGTNDDDDNLSETGIGYIYQLDAPIVGKSSGDVLKTRITITRRK